jgi:hypothetical protein
MEAKSHAKTSTPEPRNESLTCWNTSTSPQCLRVETESEIHLFAYGYFRRAKFSRKGNKESIEIHFQDMAVLVIGKGLDSLCDALGRLGVERVRRMPDKYTPAAREGVITEIEVRENDRSPIESSLSS